MPTGSTDPTSTLSADDLRHRLKRHRTSSSSSRGIACDGTYSSPEGIWAALEASEAGSLAPVRLLDSEWLLRRAEQLEQASSEARRELTLPCRQDLECAAPEAFLDVASLRKLPTGYGGALPICAVSHAWISPEHPDPCGAQLLSLASLLRRGQRGELPHQRPLDMSAAGPTGYQRLPARFGIFYDWASLCQKRLDGAEAAVGGAHEGGGNGDAATSVPAPTLARTPSRTPPERAAFEAALGSMQLWYVHQLLFTVCLTRLPAECEGLVPSWEERGWPTVEVAWAMLGKPNLRRCWPMVLDAGCESGVMARRPPLHPERLEAELAHKRFTSRKVRGLTAGPNARTLLRAPSRVGPRRSSQTACGSPLSHFWWQSDLPLVLRLYRDTTRALLSGARLLRYANCEWGGDAFTRLAEVLVFMIASACHVCLPCLLAMSACHLCLPSLLAISACHLCLQPTISACQPTTLSLPSALPSYLSDEHPI